MTVLLVGCANTYETTRTYDDIAVPKLAQDGKAYVVLPKPGGIESKIYEKSGQMTASAIYTALTKYLNTVKIGEKLEEYDDALASSRVRDASYLIIPEILRWEDRISEWSGMPDRIMVKVLVVDVPTGKLIDSVEFTGLGRGWAGHPEDLLEKPISDYFASIF